MAIKLDGNQNSEGCYLACNAGIFIFIKAYIHVFTWYDFVARDKLKTRLRHEMFCVNQTYNLLTTVVYNAKNVKGFYNRF